MKICPKCKSRTVEDIECPICGESITYEETIDEEKEKIRFNKYYLRYLLRNCLFALICTAAVIVINAINAPILDYSYFIIYGIAFMSLAASVFKRTFVMWNIIVCKERYATFTVNLFIIMSGLLSVKLAFAIW